ncbi:MAG: hypothetical protein ACQEQS_03585 [Thermodesulfobacteriota bacterium]
MRLRNKKKFIPFLILIILLSFNTLYALELPEEVTVRNTFPPKKWKKERTDPKNNGKYSVSRYYLYASTGRNENLFRDVIVWKKDDKFCVRVLRLNFVPDAFPADCLKPVNEKIVRKEVYNILNSPGSLR